MRGHGRFSQTWSHIESLCTYMLHLTIGACTLIIYISGGYIYMAQLTLTIFIYRDTWKKCIY